MKHLCCSKIILFLFILNSFLFAGDLPKSVGFYYAPNPPEELLSVYDWIVLDTEIVDYKSTNKYNSKIFSYVSICEIRKSQKYYDKIKEEWIIGENKNWNTKILDIRNSEYKSFLISTVIDEIYKKGVKNFFFDTIDSYKHILNNSKDIESYENSLISFFVEFKKKYPESKIIINRGFEIIDKIHQYIDGFVAESLFCGIDLKDMSYKEVAKDDFAWLKNKLNEVKKYNIPIIVVDYVVPSDRSKALNTANKIKNLGFIPWVSDKDLSTIGIGTYEIKRRKVLLIYDGSKLDGAFSNIHRLASMPLEYMGFIPELYDVNKGFKEDVFVDKYAGIIVWLSASTRVKNYKSFFNWFLNRINEGNKVLFLEEFGFPLEKKYCDKLKLEILDNKSELTDKIEVLNKTNIIGFESEPHIEYSDKLIKTTEGKPVLTIKNSKSQVFHPIAITNWGGYAIGNSFMLNVLDELLWVVNPFDFFREALRLDMFPIPDTTTENGNRLLLVHIDADGFSSKAEWDINIFASEVIRDKILKIYKIPHTVSVIEGELAAYGIYPELSDKLENIAKSIFALDNVSIASHSFSHPLKWQKISSEQLKYSLPIKDYVFSATREIKGSIEYINKKLAPTNKKVEVFFWSGDCLPTEDALAKTYEQGVFNINGGYTTETYEFPWLSRVSPLGLKRGKYYQIYAPVSNENFHTEMLGNSFYGYAKVINTFKLTDKPRRIKPIGIYYHFYSGSKLASLNALNKVYKWAISQDIMLLYVSEYIEKVLDFQNIGVACDGKEWIIKTDRKLKTFRIPKEFGYPDIKKSKGIIGYVDYVNDRFIHLDDSGDYNLILSNEIPKEPLLVRTNAIIKKFIRDKEKMYISLFGYIQISLVLKNIEEYIVDIEGDSLYRITQNDNETSYNFDRTGEVNVTIKHK